MRGVSQSLMDQGFHLQCSSVQRWGPERWAMRTLASGLDYPIDEFIAEQAVKRMEVMEAWPWRTYLILASSIPAPFLTPSFPTTTRWAALLHLPLHHDTQHRPMQWSCWPRAEISKTTSISSSWTADQHTYLDPLWFPHISPTSLPFLCLLSLWYHFFFTLWPPW